MPNRRPCFQRTCKGGYTVLHLLHHLYCIVSGIGQHSIQTRIGGHDLPHFLSPAFQVSNPVLGVEAGCARELVLICL